MPQRRRVLVASGLAALLAFTAAAGAFVWWRGERDASSGTVAGRAPVSRPATPPASVPQTLPPGRGAVPTGAADVSKLPTVAAGASTTPAVAGATLGRLTEPPEKTLAALSPDKCDAGVEFDIVFEPYGVGPFAIGPTVAAKVVSIKARDPKATFPDLAGRNALLSLGKLPVPAGGRRSGVGTTVEQDGRVHLVLTEVSGG